MLHSDFDENGRKVIYEHYEQRFWQLNRLVDNQTRHAIQYLFIANTGGAVVLMAYLGTAKTDMINWGHKASLFIFVIGIVLAGILIVSLLHKNDSLLLGWQSDWSEFIQDKISHQDLLEQDEGRAGSATIYYLVGYTSFGFFILGSGVGLCAFFNL